MKKHRQELECWSCDLHFSFPIPDDVATFIDAECPYCGAECAVDVKPYQSKRDALRGSRNDSQNSSQDNDPQEVLHYALPDLLKTTQTHH